VARHYDRINRTMSLGLGERYRRDALLRAGIRPGMRVLDVGSGTGVLAQFARDAVGASGAVAAVDPSAAMLDVARRRGVRDACRGVAESLPYRDASFDLVTMAYALRHVADLGRTFAEIHRVLRSGGRVLILEQTPPTSSLGRMVFRTYMGHVV